MCAAYQLPGARVQPLHRPAASIGGRAMSLLMIQTEVPLSSVPVAAAAHDNLRESDASFNNTWYAAAYSEQLGADEVFSTRLWGEPLVMYRDSGNEVVCVRDSCPHRSAPLSMGEVQDGVLRCFYHGWGFGSEGKCVSVPTMGTGKSSACATNFAVAERDGILWIWRGHLLTADASKLPREYPTPSQSLTVDTTLDYDCEWTHVMESNLASPHLTLGETAPASEFNAPNVVTHQSSEGALLAFDEEMHVVPIAPQRTRVMLRQQFQTDGALSVALQLPGSLPLFTWLVRNWNYRVAEEKYESLVQGQGAQREGDDPVARFRSWHEDALANAGQPYFIRWDNREVSRYGPQIDDADTGTYGLKKVYVQNSPKVVFAPMQHP